MIEQLFSLLKKNARIRGSGKSPAGENVAITGIGQINRSHILAGLCRELGRPMVILCQDDIAARRLQEELKSFLEADVPILPGRELTLYDAAVVSRSWEQKRLRQLYDLVQSRTPIQIMSWESMSLRTMPPAILKEASFRLEIGKEYSMDDLTARLVAAGYSRCGMVEGPTVRPPGPESWTSSPRQTTSPSGRSSSAMSWIPWAILSPQTQRRNEKHGMRHRPARRRNPARAPPQRAGRPVPRPDKSDCPAEAAEKHQRASRHHSQPGLREIRK